MFLWLIRQLLSIRKVIAGRKHPHQLAWGLALGVLVGVVPHGNLLAIALIGFVLSLRVNHAMATLAGVAVAFSATALDPYTHELGRYVLTHPELQAAWAQAWQLPLVPWTDINNTVVLGSFLVGLGAVLPAYAASYPIFRYFAPPPEQTPDDAPAPSDPTAMLLPAVPPPTAPRLAHCSAVGPAVSVMPPLDLAATSVAAVPVAPVAEQHAPTAAATGSTKHRTSEFDRPSNGDCTDAPDLVVMETQIDVIRLKDYGCRADVGPQQPHETPSAPPTDQAQMNQALSYLLRRIRDSQQGKAA